jgi:transcriptional regulator with XRE-family HTH domain
MTLSERIKEHRKKSGLSQEQIADKLGISRQAVAKWESEQSVPSMGNLIALAEIFDISLDELTNTTNDSSQEANNLTPKTTTKKSPLLLDIIFVIVAAFAIWSIFRIPAYIGMSMVGFLMIMAQICAIVYVPLYLILIRPKKSRFTSDDNAQKDIVSIKTKFFTGFCASIALFAGYLLCGHVFLFLHGMRQWSIVLFVFGLIVIAISAYSNSRKVMIGTVAGYVLGFVLGMLFGRTYYINVGDDLWIPRHNAWQIWTLIFIALIIVGIVVEIISKRKK